MVSRDLVPMRERIAGPRGAGKPLGVSPAAERPASFSSAPCPFAAEPFGICRHLSSVLLNNLVSRCASHQACTGLRRRQDLFTHHALGFTLSRFAAAHQLRDPKSDHAIAF